MVPYEILKKKRDGKRVSEEEMRFLIEGYLAGNIPEYIISAFLMATFIRGMEPEEIATLTSIYIESGIKMEFPGVTGALVDKHSTGGVGDKVSLILAPLVAACGLSVPMLSGRGLGHTGGTLDKLESMPGFRTDLSPERFTEQVEGIGLAIAAQSKDLCPADGRIYALRDVTGTVESIPLITASIMSKKIAEGTQNLILDVKVGTGAFMKSDEQAQALAKSLIAVGNLHNVNTQALMTDMSEPLGIFVGNALEARESIEILRGESKEPRLMRVIMALAVNMILQSGIRDNAKDAYALAREKLDNGEALQKFRDMVEWQKGDPAVCDNLDMLPKAKYTTAFKAAKAGHITFCETERIGMASVALGAGRITTDSIIDPAVGFEVLKHYGDKVEKDEPIIIVHHNKEDIAETLKQLTGAYHLGDEAPAEKPLFHGLLTADGIKEWKEF